MINLLGIVYFQQPLPCRGDTLGNTYTAIINGVNVRVFFPELRIIEQDSGDKEPIIDKPVILQTHRVDNWGSVFSYKMNHTEDSSLIGTWINQVVITCQIDDDNEFRAVVNKLSDGINTWRTQLYECSCLSSKSFHVTKDMDYFERQGKATGFDLYNQKDYSKVKLQSFATLHGVMYTAENCWAPEEIQQTLAKIDVSKHLKSEYNMYLNALIEQAKENTRYAIMEATTAVELCVTQKIQDRCIELGIDGKGLCDMFYRSLGDRFSLLEQLGVAVVTNDPKKEIVKPRNDLFHNRMLVPTMKECVSVLDAVRAYLNAYIPDMYE